MTERAFISQGLQVGAESTPGTPVAANKKLVTVGVESGVKVDAVDFTPVGQKYASIVFPGKEWTEFKLTGVGSYSELLWIFSSVLIDPGAPTTVDTTAKKYVFTPSSTSADTVRTLSMEQGDAVRAQKWAYGLIDSVEMKFTRQGVDISGSGIGQAMQDNITLTATPTTPTLVPIFGNQIDVYADTTSAGLGTTKLTRVIEVTITVGSRFQPVWVLNTANGSYVAHVEVKPTAEFKILMEADATWGTQLTNLRAATTNYFRVQGTSTQLAGSTTQKFQMIWDAALKVKDVAPFSDNNGIYAVELTYEQVYDPTWGKAYNVQLINQEASL